MKSPAVPQTGVPELNMTSMIDVIFLLLIFFVFTADFDHFERMLPMNLSQPGKVVQNNTPLPEESSEPVRIRLFGSALSAASWDIGEEHFSDREELAQRLQEMARRSLSTSILIIPDQTVPMEMVLDLYDLCRENGLTLVQFAAHR